MPHSDQRTLKLKKIWHKHIFTYQICSQQKKHWKQIERFFLGFIENIGCFFKNRLLCVYMFYFDACIKLGPTKLLYFIVSMFTEMFLIDTADFMVKYAICNIRYAITSLYKTDDMTYHTRIWDRRMISTHFS